MQVCQAKNLTSFATSNIYLKLKYGYRHFQKAILIVIETLIRTKLWVLEWDKKRKTFPYVLHKTRQHYRRASSSNSWSVMQYNDTILTSIGCLFKWLNLSIFQGQIGLHGHNPGMMISHGCNVDNVFKLKVTKSVLWGLVYVRRSGVVRGAWWLKPTFEALNRVFFSLLSFQDLILILTPSNRKLCVHNSALVKTRFVCTWNFDPSMLHFHT